MKTDKTMLGDRGEERTARYLESIGYEILERNYRCRGGEIDIVAREGDDLVFVEVKSRRNTNSGFPSEAVDSRKQRKLIIAGRQFLIDRDLGEVSCRFDIAEVFFRDAEPVSVNMIKGAFADDSAWG